MKVSVIIPLYNKEQTIRRSLESVRSQTYRNFEVIVVDDGSTDRSFSVARNFTGIESYRCFSQQNRGPGAARNAGAAMARGELLAFLDADDEWLPQFLEQSVVRMERHKDCAATVSGYLEFPAGKSREQWWRQRGLLEGSFNVSSSTGTSCLLAHLDYMCPWSTIVRAPVFEKWGGFFERNRCVYAEDSYLWIKILFNEKVFFSFEPLVKFHRENSSLSANLKGPRPVEPFLLHPEEILDSVSCELRGVAEKILTARAAKTSCMLGYWGRWRDAASLLHRFISPQLLILPYGYPALLCSTPFGAGLGRCVRQLLYFRQRITK